jgi:hypothetical protein
MVVYWWRYRCAAKRGELDEPQLNSITQTIEEPKLTHPGDSIVSRTKDANPVDQSKSGMPEGRSFTLFIHALLLAYVAVLVRCIYR